jgi:hypothetical protein
MSIQRVDFWTGVLVTLGWALAIGLYAALHRQAGGFVSPALFAFVPPAAATAIWAWIAVMVAHQPPSESAPSVRDHLRLTQVLVAALCVVPLAMTLLTRSGASLSYVAWQSALAGTCFIVLGNRMGRLRQNSTIGVRNMWTIADSEVWLRTHRLLARVMVLGGVAIVAAAFLQPEQGSWVLAAVAATTIAAVVVRAYSFLEYRRRHRG